MISFTLYLSPGSVESGCGEGDVRAGFLFDGQPAASTPSPSDPSLPHRAGASSF